MTKQELLTIQSMRGYTERRKKSAIRPDGLLVWFDDDGSPENDLLDKYRLYCPDKAEFLKVFAMVRGLQCARTYACLYGTQQDFEIVQAQIESIIDVHTHKIGDTNGAE